MLLSDSEGIGLLVTSDTLLPMHMAWDTHRFAAAWSSYQWPRIPSLVPDMFYFHGAERLGIGWRRALLGFIPTMLGLLALGMGAIIARVRRCGLAQATAQAALALAALMAGLAALAAAFGFGPWAAVILVVMPVSHGSGFILSLFAAAAADAALRGSRRAFWATMLLCFVGTFCDLLFVAAFLVPLAVATRIPVIRATMGQGVRTLRNPAAVLRLAAQNGALVYGGLLACLTGWACQRLLKLQPVGGYLFRHPGDAITQMVRDFGHTPWTGLAAAGSIALIAKAVAVSCQAPDAAAPDRQSERFLIVHGAVAAALGLGLLAVTYVDPNSWRYGMACIWWPLTIGLALRRPVRRASVAPAAARWLIGGGLLLAATLLALLRPPPLLTWHSPLETCLTGARARLGLRHGLATYWLARANEASSDWRWQVRPIAENGHVLPWGDDPTLYARDANKPAAPARFNFIVIDPGVDRAAIVGTFGAPARRSACPDAELWVYDHWLSPS